MNNELLPQRCNTTPNGNRQSTIGNEFPPVVLINMPFANLMTPSIGLGLLKAALKNSGIPARVLNFQFRFAVLIGEQNYARIHSAARTEHLAGEFIFSPALFGEGTLSGTIEQYVDDILRGHANGASQDTAYSESFVESLSKVIVIARKQTETFLQECVDAVLSLQPRVVGFTSLFHQHVASLSLARRIKAQLPNVFIVFGGSNCEGPMGAETLRRFEFVDAVVSGEGEFVFPEIVSRLYEDKSLPKLQGVFGRNCSELPMLQQSLSNTPIVDSLDTLPLPDYDEYFEQFNSNSLSTTRKPSLLFETSRGCWWGAKQHCTFCGLNGETMAYRSKSATRAFSEFVYLTDKYPGCSINVVDNILDMHYFKDFIPMLAQRNHGLNLFYEVKANLSKEQLRLLLQAGITEIQPGIESLSDNVLRIMRKGVTALQNVQLMKWCKELGLKVYYNLIWGFPGEQESDYLEMDRVISLISHLQPPVGQGPIRIDRFSPNFEQAEQLGFGNLLPHPAYRFVYPFEGEGLRNIAYFFASENGPTSNLRTLMERVSESVKNWRSSYPKSDLFWIDKGSRLLIWDLRPMAAEKLIVLTGHERLAYLACDRITTARQIVDICRSGLGTDSIDESGVRVSLENFTNRGLMISQGGSYLSLAYPRSLKDSQA